MSTPSRYHWRTVDILVAAVIAVAFGVVFQFANGLWDATKGVFAFYPPAQAVIYGVWLVPAVLAALIVRKAGAAVFTETVAAAVSTLLGSPYGVMAIVYGVAEGAGAEAAFAAGGYRRYGAGIACLSGGLGGAIVGAMDTFIYYDYPAVQALVYIGSATLSCAVIAGLGSVALTRSLAATGVLDTFPSGRRRSLV